MEIRKAELSDMERIIEINNIVDYGQPDEFIKKCISNDGVLVAIKNDTIVAFLLYQNIWWNTILLALLKVHSDFYSQGIGSKLLEYFENMLRDMWISSYTSSTMQDNPWAQNFHMKNWFKNIGTLDMHYGSEIFYRKDL